MIRRNLLCAAVLATMSIFAIQSIANARLMRTPYQQFAPVPDRVAMSEAVVIGKVVRVEGKSEFVSMPLPPQMPTHHLYNRRDFDQVEQRKQLREEPVQQLVNQQKVEFQVLVVEIIETLAGNPGLTHVRVGLPVAQQNNNMYLEKQLQLERLGGGLAYYPQTANIGVGASACFFLRTDANCGFFPADHQTVLPKVDQASFDAQIKQVKQMAKLIDKPMDGLKSKDASERFLTAAMLIHRYRTAPASGKSKTENLDAEQSRLIIEALIEADWNQQHSVLQKMPYQLFTLLNLTEKDGWKQPQTIRTQNDYRDALSQWLKANGDKYRMQRIVLVD